MRTTHETPDTSDETRHTTHETRDTSHELLAKTRDTTTTQREETSRAEPYPEPRATTSHGPHVLQFHSHELKVGDLTFVKLDDSQEWKISL